MAIYMSRADLGGCNPLVIMALAQSDPAPAFQNVSQKLLSAGSTIVGILRQCQIAYQNKRVVYGFLFGTSRFRTQTSQEDHGDEKCSSRLFGEPPISHTHTTTTTITTTITTTTTTTTTSIPLPI